MPGLADIAPSSRVVDVGGARIAVTGIDAAGLAYLIAAHPEVKALMAGKDVAFDAASLALRAPRLLAAVIACGTGAVNNPAEEEAAARLKLGVQVELFDAIVEVTFPNGLAAFAAAVKRLAEAVMGAASGAGFKAPASSSPPPSMN